MTVRFGDVIEIELPNTWPDELRCLLEDNLDLLGASESERAHIDRLYDEDVWCGRLCMIGSGIRRQTSGLVAGHLCPPPGQTTPPTVKPTAKPNSCVRKRSKQPVIANKMLWGPPLVWSYWRKASQMGNIG